MKEALESAREFLARIESKNIRVSCEDPVAMICLKPYRIKDIISRISNNMGNRNENA
jgi:PP-loop superfamily ATP-utilizing enzyme